MFESTVGIARERSQAIRGSTSAPTARVLDVVELLARPGNARLRFSDVVRELDLTQATAHAILKTLCDRGWASRDPVDEDVRARSRARRGGGARTDTARPLAHAARSAALRLSANSATPLRWSSGSAIRWWSPPSRADRHQPSGIPGDRIPYAPPFGVAFAAWDTDEEQRAWIRRGAGTNAARAQRLEEVLAHTRERGFDVDWTTPALAQAAQVVGTLDSDEMPTPVRQIMDQLLVEFTTIGFLSDDDPGRAAARGDHRRAGFRRRGRVALIVAVHPLEPMSLRQITAVGRRWFIRRTAARLA